MRDGGWNHVKFKAGTRSERSACSFCTERRRAASAKYFCQGASGSEWFQSRASSAANKHLGQARYPLHSSCILTCQCKRGQPDSERRLQSGRRESELSGDQGFEFTERRSYRSPSAQALIVADGHEAASGKWSA
jgi:hypothetical protein